MNYRVFVNKKQQFQIESESLYRELKTNLSLTGLTGIEYYNIYETYPVITL